MKLFLLSILSVILLSASDNSQALKIQILEKILTEVSIDKEIKIWSDNQNILDGFKNSSKFKTVDECTDANIIILDKQMTLSDDCKKKYIFVLRYNLLNDIKESFGALFWKKGRPNIVILQPRIKAQSIKVSKALSPYLEERVW